MVALTSCIISPQACVEDGHCISRRTSDAQFGFKLNDKGQASPGPCGTVLFPSREAIRDSPQEPLHKFQATSRIRRPRPPFIGYRPLARLQILQTLSPSDTNQMGPEVTGSRGNVGGGPIWAHTHSQLGNEAYGQIPMPGFSGLQGVFTALSIAHSHIATCLRLFPICSRCQEGKRGTRVYCTFLQLVKLCNQRCESWRKPSTIKSS